MLITFGVGWQITLGVNGDVTIGDVIGDVTGDMVDIGDIGDDGGSTALTVIPSFRRSNV